MKYAVTLMASALLSTQVPVPSSDLRLNGDEAKAVLMLLERQEAGQTITDEDWRRLFATEGYRRLKEREAGMGRPFTDEEFKAFVTGEDLRGQRADLARTVREWLAADMSAAEAKAGAYLPAGTRIRATIFPVIKPHENSFVWDTRGDPAIFLYLNPAVDKMKFENTVAHELHHIGYSAACADVDFPDASAPAKAMNDWLGALGEGVAMLAAAGSPNIHPHATSASEDRARWDRDMANFDRDLRTLADFFNDIREERLTGDAIVERGMTFFGVQGPWYTVGWRMASAIEEEFGRAALVETLCEPRAFLTAYNRAAAQRGNGKALPSWPAETIEALPAKGD